MLKRYLQDFLALFFPDLCASCGTHLFSNEHAICTNCIYHLPVTNFHKDPSNKLAKQLWGRFHFKQASSYVFFRKAGKVQNIIHNIKYNGRSEVGYRMGQLYATSLKSSGTWIQPDLIIPVPLHPEKIKKRGYNQSEVIANGIASVIAVPVLCNNLKRTSDTETQTKKSRFSRYENLREAFICLDQSTLKNKHLLIVDDVMTTGATVEACCMLLLTIEGVEVSIATIAFTE